MAPTKELLDKLKTLKLPGEYPLTQRSILPSLTLFSSRPKEFLDELRRIREGLVFKAGPSKKRSTVSGAEDEAEGSDDSTQSADGRARKAGNKNASGKASSRTAKAKNFDIAKAAILSNSTLTDEQKQNLIEAFRLAK